MNALLPVLALGAALAAVPAAAIPRPDIPTGAAAREPDLLSPYQRRVLSLELARLRKEIVAARREAARSAELEPYRAALAQAREGGDATNVAAKAQALSDATEAILFRDEEIPGKLKRLQEVGLLLEYDSRREKQKRASHPPRPFPFAQAKDAKVADDAEGARADAAEDAEGARAEDAEESRAEDAEDAE